jgi:hypothetical protein
MSVLPTDTYKDTFYFVQKEKTHFMERLLLNTKHRRDWTREANL